MPNVHLVIRTWMGRESFALDWEPNAVTAGEVNAGRARTVEVSREVARVCGLNGVVALFRSGLLT